MRLAHVSLCLASFLYLSFLSFFFYLYVFANGSERIELETMEAAASDLREQEYRQRVRRARYWYAFLTISSIFLLIMEVAMSPKASGDDTTPAGRRLPAWCITVVVAALPMIYVPAILYALPLLILCMTAVGIAGASRGHPW